MSVSTLASNYARALRRLEAARFYVKNMELPPDRKLGVRVEWSWGSQVSGYHEVQEKVIEEVETLLLHMMKKSVVSIENDVSKAHNELRDAAFPGGSLWGATS